MKDSMEEIKNIMGSLLAEEEQLQFSKFTNDMAFELGNMIIQTAKQENKTISVGIRRNGQRLFHFSMTGTSKDNNCWIERKSNLVDHFGHSSYYMAMYYKSRGVSMKEKSALDDSQYAAAGGAFPIILKNVGNVGVIAVSGLSQEEDHKLVVRVIRDYLNL